MKKNNAEKYPLGILGEIFGRVWAIWGLLCFVVTMIIFMIPFFAASYFKTRTNQNQGDSSSFFKGMDGSVSQSDPLPTDH